MWIEYWRFMRFVHIEKAVPIPVPGSLARSVRPVLTLQLFNASTLQHPRTSAHSLVREVRMALTGLPRNTCDSRTRGPRSNSKIAFESTEYNLRSVALK